MKLTKKRALDFSIELWAWLTETGERHKDDWPKWEEYGEAMFDCFLCEYARKDEETFDCGKCPYYKKFGYACVDEDKEEAAAPFLAWHKAKSRGTRKKYASLFLEQLKAIRRG